MKKILLTLAAASLLASCVDTSPILTVKEYTIVDTVKVNRNAFDAILSYDIILLNHYDSMYHAGSITPEGKLRDYNARPIKFK